MSKIQRQKMSWPEGHSNPPTFRFMSNAQTTWIIRDRHLLSHVFEYWLWWYRYFKVKLTFQKLPVHGQQATAFIFYGSVLVSWCAKNGHILTAPEHLLTAPEDLYLFRKTYNCYGRLITVPEDLLTAPEHLLTAPEHLLTAPEHFRNCSGALS